MRGQNSRKVKSNMQSDYEVPMSEYRKPAPEDPYPALEYMHPAPEDADGRKASGFIRHTEKKQLLFRKKLKMYLTMAGTTLVLLTCTDFFDGFAKEPAPIVEEQVDEPPVIETPVESKPVEEPEPTPKPEPEPTPEPPKGLYDDYIGTWKSVYIEHIDDNGDGNVNEYRENEVVDKYTYLNEVEYDEEGNPTLYTTYMMEGRDETYPNPSMTLNEDGRFYVIDSQTDTVMFILYGYLEDEYFVMEVDVEGLGDFAYKFVTKEYYRKVE